MDDDSKAQLDKAYKDDLAKAEEKIRQEEAHKLSKSGFAIGLEDYTRKLESNVAQRIEGEQPAQKLEALHYGELGGKEEVERQNQEWKKQQQEQARIQEEQAEQKRKAQELQQQQTEESTEQETASTVETQPTEELTKEEKMADYNRRMREHFERSSRQGREEDVDRGR